MKKTLSLLLSAFVILTNGGLSQAAEGHVWESRRAARPQLAAAPGITGPLSTLGLAPISALRPASAPLVRLPAGSPALQKAFAAVPRGAGTVRKVLVPRRPDGRVVLYVQDVHGNVEAQSNIAAALTGVARALPLKVLALEGAAEQIDVEAFRAVDEPSVKMSVAEKMLRDGLIAGSVLAAWNAPAPINVVGVDSATLHEANVGAYLASRALRDASRARWAAEWRRLEAAKKEVFNPALAAFDAAVDAHRAGRLPLGDFAALLQRERGRPGAPLDAFITAHALERSLDFARVERERESVLKRLVAKITDAQTKALLDLGLAYKSGQVGPGEFNDGLAKLCAAAGVDLAAFPALSRYLAYVRASDGIDVEALFADMTAAESEAYDRLAREPEERRLARRSKALYLAGRLIDFALSREEWTAYRRLKPALSGFDLTVFESFYQAAEARDRAMADGVLREMRAAKTDTAALVTGGFHSSGVERRLLEAGVSVLRFTPKITRAGNESTLAALSVFAQEKTPLEQIFEGRRLFLAAHPQPVQARRVAALRFAAALAFLGRSVEGIVAWLGRAMPWQNLRFNRAPTKVVVSGVEARTGRNVTFNVEVDDDGRITPIDRSPEALIERLRNRLLDVALIRPLIETLILVVVHSAFISTFPGSAQLAPIFLGVIFAALHPSVYEPAPDGRFSLAQAAFRFVALSAAGIVFVSFLSSPLGAGKSFAVHAAYNAAIATARTAVEARAGPARSTAEVLVEFLASLPYAMVRRRGLTRNFKVERTNNVEKIVKGLVVRIDGAAYAPVRAAAAPARSIPEAEIDAEVQKPGLMVNEMIARAETSTDPAEFEIAEKVLMFNSRESAAIEKEIREKKVPAARAIRNVVERMLQDERVKEKPALRESYEFGLTLAEALEASETPAAAARVLSDADLAAEVERPGAKVSQLIDEAGTSDDPADFEIAEKILMFNTRESSNIAKEIREGRKTAAQAIRDVVARMLQDDRVKDKPALREVYEFGLTLADKLEADDAAAPKGLSDAEIETEIAKPGAMVSQLIDEAGTSDDPADFEIAEKILMFNTRESSNIAKEIREGRKTAAQAIRDVVARMLQDDRVKDKPALREVYEFGLTLADKLEPQAQAPATNEPADPLEDVTGSVVLVVKNPDNALMARLVTDPLKRVKAVVLAGGYEAKHWSSLLAQNAGIPVLGGLTGETTENVYDVLNDGETILVDSINHTVTANPSSAREAGFERRIEEQTAELEVLAGWGGKSNVTRDGVPVRFSSVLVDFPLSKEIEAINNNAAGTVGLFRMEFLYADSRPDEDTLAGKFFDLASKLNGTLGIRAIDRRPGDKNTIFDTMPGNEKAELTWLLETETGEAALRSLIRSLLKAHARLPKDKKNIKFFVPMVERRDQAERVISILDDEKLKMSDASGIDLDELDMSFGVMIETKIETKELEGILSLKGVEFASVGTRDLAESLKVRDVMHRSYLEEVKKIVTTAVKYGKDVSLCGEHTSNEGLFLFVNSIPMDNARLPSWAVVPRNIARMKALTRAVNRAALAARVKGGVAQKKIKRELDAAKAAAREEIHRSAEFESTFNQVLVQEGVSEAVQSDFDSTTYRHLRGVTAYASRGKVSAANAGRTGYDFSLINPLGRLAVSALQYTGSNGNRALIYLARLAQSWIDRVVFSKDSRNRWTIIGAEGHRPGKDPQGTLPVGAHLGFGRDAREMLLLSMETPAGLTSAVGENTVVGRVYGDEHTLTPMPDAYMFKIAAAPRLKDAGLAEVIAAAQVPGQDGVDLALAAAEMVKRAERILGRKPRVGVLLRDRQSALIDSLTGSLGIDQDYLSIKARMEGGVSRQEFVGKDADGGALHVYEYDDWTAGLTFADESGLDFFIGTGGTPEAQMSAVLAKKMNASFAAVLVPQDNAAFTDQERAALARGEIRDARHVYVEHDLVPGDADDVAVGVAVLRDFRLSADDPIPGPRVRDDGQVEAHVIWVANAGIEPVRLVYPTSLTDALRKFKRNAQNEEAALNVALGWAEFGAYDKAAALAKDRMGKAKGADAKRWKAIDLFARAGLALTAASPNDGDKATDEAIGLYEQTLTALADPDLSALAVDLAVVKRLRRLHYHLRDKALREARAADGARRTELLALAVSHASRAFAYATRGLETRRRENNVRLEAFVDAFDRWESAQWAVTNVQPKLPARLDAALNLWLRFKDDPATAEYAATLSAAGADIFNAALFATALREEPLDDQARILRFLHRNEEARALAARVATDPDLDRPAAVAEALRLIDAGRVRRTWQAKVLDAIPGERRVVRPELRQLLPRMENRPEAGAVLTELIMASMAKAEIMPALGNADRRVPYLLEAAQYAQFIEANPRLFGAIPLPVIFEFSVLYQDLVQAGETAFADKAKAFTAMTTDETALKTFLSGLKDDAGRRIYSDAEIGRINERRAALAAEHVTHLGDRGTGAPAASSDEGTPPAVNSLPFYLALLWNRLVGDSAWRVQRPERWIRPGYAAEIIAGLALIVAASAAPWAADPVVTIFATPVTGLAVAVLAVVVIYALLHAGAAAIASGGAPARELLSRWGLHTAGFLPYVAFAQAVALDPALGSTVVLLGIGVALWHAAFDERLARTAPEVPLTAAQQARYEQILAALRGRESAEGGLSRRVNSIRPNAADGGRLATAFDRAIEAAARRAALSEAPLMTDAIEAALQKAPAGPILVFISANGPAAGPLVSDAFARARERNDAGRRPVLIAVDPDVNDPAVDAAIAAARQAHPNIPSAVRRLGADVSLREGAFHYEDLFAAFAADPSLRANPAAAAMLERLAAGQSVGGARIVQISASAQPFIGRPDLLALILLIVPVKATGVLIDLNAALLVAKQA